jgi:ppGpp synthetase/RelA/SpoT-type nucleotidyltranferase
MDKADFLERNNISPEDFIKADIEWKDLLSIFSDFQDKRAQLEGFAEFVVKGIQAFDEVHSVRWRVKDPEHLLEKIIRKRCESNPSKKYLNISVENYTSIVTDLVGVRALHLFKDQAFDIHSKIKKMWAFSEKPVSYVREGDDSELLEQFRSTGITPKVHKAGYRSVHYVLKMKPNLSEFRIELQVRTIFEEGWSEIDHKVRYPNFSNNKQIETILKIFNRLAGSADELGAFIRGLSLELDRFDGQINQAAVERDDALEKMQLALNELAAAQQKNGEGTEKVKEVQNELDRFKTTVTLKYPAKKEGIAQLSREEYEESMRKILASITSSVISNPTFFHPDKYKSNSKLKDRRSDQDGSKFEDNSKVHGQDKDKDKDKDKDRDN